MSCSKWIEDIRAERGSDVILVLVGNKTDMSDNRAVSSEEAEEYARKENILFAETSAKAGYNIKGLFKKVAMALPVPPASVDEGAAISGDSRKTDASPVIQNLNLGTKPAASSGGCSC